MVPIHSSVIYIFMVILMPKLRFQKNFHILSFAALWELIVERNREYLILLPKETMFMDWEKMAMSTIHFILMVPFREALLPELLKMGPLLVQSTEMT